MLPLMEEIPVGYMHLGILFVSQLGEGKGTYVFGSQISNLEFSGEVLVGSALSFRKPYTKPKMIP